MPMTSPGLAPAVHAGPILKDLRSSAADDLEAYLAEAGFELTRSAPEPGDLIDELDRALVRGRAGGAFPTAVKWRHVAGKTDETKYVVCNVHTGQPGGFKESWLIRSFPYRILDAVTLAAYAVGAREAIIYLGRSLREEEGLLRDCVANCVDRELLGHDGELGVRVTVFRSPAGYVSGEETAALELLEGRAGRPRGKPPMPTRTGLRGAPTLIQNLGTLLQAHFALRFGADTYRTLGTEDSPGTLLLTVSGAIARPGIYEVETGTTLRHVLENLAGGALDGAKLEAAIVGGTSGGLLRSSQLDLPLDYDAVADVGVDLGSGVILAVSDATPIHTVAVELAKFYRDNSCGQCQPCWDGTARIVKMLKRLENLDERGVDIADRSLKPSLRGPTGLRVLSPNEVSMPAPSYTDTVKGLDKLSHLAEWFKYRGECHFVTEAARSIQLTVQNFKPELEELRAPAVVKGE